MKILQGDAISRLRELPCTENGVHFSLIRAWCC